MVLDRFAGTWSIDRAVRDARAGLDGTLRGTATFAPADDGALAYVEVGALTFGGATSPARRALVLRARPAGTTDEPGAVDVLFADGRAFYGFDLVDGRWSGEHACGQDTYRVSGRFLDADSFEEIWHATGPHKDYRLTTTYRRVPGAGGPGAAGPQVA